MCLAEHTTIPRVANSPIWPTKEPGGGQLFFFKVTRLYGRIDDSTSLKKK
jgi:hypothetical protein